MPPQTAQSGETETRIANIPGVGQITVNNVPKGMSDDDFRTQFKTRHPEYFGGQPAQAKQPGGMTPPPSMQGEPSEGQPEQPGAIERLFGPPQGPEWAFPTMMPLRFVREGSQALGRAATSTSETLSKLEAEGKSDPSAVLHYPLEAGKTVAKIGEGVASPENFLLTAAMLTPIGRLLGAAYMISTGGAQVFAPKQEGEGDADYLERFLLGLSGMAAGAAAGIGFRGPGFSEKTRVNKATFAAGGGKTAFADTIGDLEATLRQTPRKFGTVADMAKLIEDTESRFDSYRQQALFPIRGQKLVPQQIADALMEEAKKPNLQKTPEGIKIAKAYKGAATSFQRPWTIQELELEQQRLRGSTNPIDKIIEQNAREILDSELSRRYPKQDFASLRARREQLEQLHNRLDKRVEDLRDAQAKEKGGPKIAGEHVTGSAGKHGLLARVYAKLPGQGPETKANIAAGQAFGKGSFFQRGNIGPGTQLAPLRGGPTPPPSLQPTQPPPPPPGTPPPGGGGASPPGAGSPPGAPGTPPAAAAPPGPRAVPPRAKAQPRTPPPSIAATTTGAEPPATPDIEKTLQESVAAAKKGKKMTPPAPAPAAKLSLSEWAGRAQSILKSKGKVLTDPAALERIKKIDWRAMYEEGLAPAHAVSRAIKIATDPNYKPSPGRVFDIPGPGGANVTDPHFYEDRFGQLADHLNSLHHDFTGLTMKFFNDMMSGHYQLTSPLEQRQVPDAQAFLDKYNSDPDFKNLADAARHYVHNYQAIGDIDKLTLGEPTHHPEALSTIEHAGDVKVFFNVDPDTTLLDGTKDGRWWLDAQEGKQIVETLYSAIRNSTERKVPLYRGVMKVNPPLKPGETFSMPLSSFSLYLESALDFGNIVFEIQGPSKHMNVMPFNAYSEQEFITQGRFEVVSDEQRQIERNRWGVGQGGSWLKPVRYIIIRQIGVH